MARLTEEKVAKAILQANGAPNAEAIAQDLVDFDLAIGDCDPLEVDYRFAEYLTVAREQLSNDNQKGSGQR